MVLMNSARRKRTGGPVLADRSKRAQPTRVAIDLHLHAFALVLFRASLWIRELDQRVALGALRNRLGERINLVLLGDEHT
jgi:hypothetical protein